MKKFVELFGTSVVKAAPEYGQAGGFGANIDNQAAHQTRLKDLVKSWNDTHFYYSYFECPAGSVCSKVWKQLGTPEIFKGKSTSTNFLICGPESGLPLHAHQKTWQGLVTGRKAWFLIPPTG